MNKTGLNNKYQTSKNKKPETKQEIIQHQIEELINRRYKETDPSAKQAINAEITKLFRNTKDSNCKNVFLKRFVYVFKYKNQVP